MKVITRDLSYLKTDIKITPLTDFHLGSPQCNIKQIKKLLKKIEKDETAFCFLGGDIMDTTLKTSVGSVYENTMQPMEQLDFAVELLKPLADKGKILAIVGGNHEARISKDVGLDLTKLLACQLGIADVFCPETCLLFLKVGEKKHKKRPYQYISYITHGTGGGRRAGSKINRLVDLANIVDADVYYCGHTHQPASIKQDFIRPNYTNNSISQITRTFVNSSASLKYGGYGEVQGYSPSSISYPTVIYKGKGSDELGVRVVL